jgi:hypothetical protein
MDVEARLEREGEGHLQWFWARDAEGKTDLAIAPSQRDWTTRVDGSVNSVAAR